MTNSQAVLDLPTMFSDNGIERVCHGRSGIASSSRLLLRASLALGRG